MRALILTLVLAATGPGAALAQAAPAPQTLGDIRQNLVAIDEAVQALRAELAATGGRLPKAAGNPQARLDALEAQVRELTGQIEAAENRVRRMAEDAGRRYADVEFRLSEIEGGDTALLPKAIPLGGETPAETPPGTPPVAVTAVTEQNAFDAARKTFDAGPAGDAAAAFRVFLAEYPDSPLKPEATYFLAEAQFRTGATREAAKLYLVSFQLAPAGPQAPHALFGVGSALQALGQIPEACLTFREIDRRFPATDAALAAKVVEARRTAPCP